MDRRKCCRYNINCDPHSDEMQNVHRANAGNAAKLNRFRCSSIENSYCKDETSIPLL